MCGECRLVDVLNKDMTEYATELKTLLSEFNPKDIFKVDDRDRLIFLVCYPTKLWILRVKIVMEKNAAKTSLLFSSAPICQALKRYLSMS